MSDFCSKISFGSARVENWCRDIKNAVLYTEESADNKRTSRCSVNQQGPTLEEATGGDAKVSVPPKGILNEAGVNGDLYVSDGGVATIPAPLVIDIRGDRLQSTTIVYEPVKFIVPNAKDKIVKLIIECVPEELDPSLANQDIDGMLNTAEVAKSSKAYPIKDSQGNVLYYIKDPRQPQNRVPVYFSAYSLEDKTDKMADINNQEVCSATSLGQGNCSQYRIGASGSTSTITPYVFIVDPKAYTSENGKGANEGLFKFSFNLMPDASNMTAGQLKDYKLYLRVRIVIENKAANLDSGPAADTVTTDAGVSDAGAPDAVVPDTSYPDAGVPDQGPDQ